jgi:hypothetical protein
MTKLPLLPPTVIEPMVRRVMAKPINSIYKLDE